jgi:hypothetical protein
MTKTLLTIMTVLVLLFGAAGVTVAAADNNAMNELSNALQTRSQQLIQVQITAQSQERTQSTDQVQEQVQLRLDTTQKETCSGTQDLERIRLRDQDQVQQSQNQAISNQGNSYGEGPQNRPEPGRQAGKP